MKINKIFVFSIFSIDLIFLIFFIFKRILISEGLLRVTSLFSILFGLFLTGVLFREKEVSSQMKLGVIVGPIGKLFVLGSVFLLFSFGKDPGVYFLIGLFAFYFLSTFVSIGIFLWGAAISNRK